MFATVLTALGLAGIAIWYRWGTFPAIAYSCVALTVFGAVDTKKR